jgi:hypothetical protein
VAGETPLSGDLPRIRITEPGDVRDGLQAALQHKDGSPIEDSSSAGDVATPDKGKHDNAESWHL